MKFDTRRRGLFVFVATLAAAATGAADAALSLWVNPLGGAFDAVENWDVGVPTAGDDALFDLGETYTVLLGGPTATQLLTVDSDEVTLDLATFSYQAGEIALGDGDGNTGYLTLTGGTVSTAGEPLLVRVGKDLGAEGRLTIQAATTLASTGDLLVGDAGFGELWIEAGGTVNAVATFIGDDAESSGSLLVGGPAATFTGTGQTTVGNLGDGAATVSGGATVSLGAVFVADEPGSIGAVTVQDPGSSWSMSGALALGNAGNGTLTVQGGASASCQGLGKIGDALGADGSIVLAGAGSQLTLGAETFVGNLGTGSIDVSGGATLDSTRVKIGDEIGSTGDVTVTGPSSTWTDSVEIFVGNFGGGTLAVSAGGTVSGAAATIADDPGSSGDVSVDGPGSSWTTTGNLAVGDLGTGVLTVTNGGAVEAAAVTLGVGVGASGTVTVNGTDAQLTATGAMQIGAGGPGFLVLAGNGRANANAGYLQTANGALTVELGPTTTGAVVVGGTANLAGGLDVTLAAGFTPTPGTSYVIVDADTRSGTFASVTLAPGLSLVYEPDRVLVNVEGAPPCDGDVDGSGEVAFADLLAVLSAWGPCPGCPADIDGDGEVAFPDLLAVLSGWGPCP